MIFAYMALAWCVTFVVYLAGIRTHRFNNPHTVTGMSTKISPEVEVLNTYIYLIPIGASMALLLMYFFTTTYYLMLGICGVYGAWAVYYTVLGFLPSKTHSGLSAGLLIILWATWNHWIITNFIAACLAIMSAFFLRPRNLRVCTLFLVLIVVYDAFWVWVSPYIFPSNVMAEVAMRPPPSPLHIPSVNWTLYTIDLPVRFVMVTNAGSVVLGLGDVVLPTMYLTYLRGCDVAIWYQHDVPLTMPHHLWGFFGVGLIGYLCGLHVVLGVALSTNSAQPAMVYIVPCLLLSVWFKMKREGYRHWDLVWKGHAGYESHTLFNAMSSIQNACSINEV